MKMGFIDVLEKNGFEVTRDGQNITAKKGGKTYAYRLGAFNSGDINRYDRGGAMCGSPSIAYFDGKEIAYDVSRPAGKLSRDAEAKKKRTSCFDINALESHPRTGMGPLDI